MNIYYRNTFFTWSIELVIIPKELYSYLKSVNKIKNFLR